MPTYEYVCTECQNEWEEIQKISEPALEVCPKCKKTTAKRQISGGNFILKGGGWYADLYSSPKPGKSSSEGATTPTPAAKSDAGASSPPASGGASTPSSGGTSSGGTSSGGTSSGSSGSSGGGGSGSTAPGSK